MLATRMKTTTASRVLTAPATAPVMAITRTGNRPKLRGHNRAHPEHDHRAGHQQPDQGQGFGKGNQENRPVGQPCVLGDKGQYYVQIMMHPAYFSFAARFDIRINRPVIGLMVRINRSLFILNSIIVSTDF
jgi:hypothetical protein